ncbi:MAG: DUF885 domain-containing protein [Woeseiaceae bacterium]|nr:DUF885 domain-containing protein [Woeseiaceae bacterium]
MYRKPTLILVSVLLGIAAAAADEITPAEAQLESLMAEYWDYVLAENPLAATRAGLKEYNDRMPSVTPADQARRLAAEQRFLARSRDLGRDSMSVTGQANAEVFEWVLEDSIGAYELNLSRIPFNTFSGFFMRALSASNGVRMESAADYEQYIARLADIPRYFDENLANMETGEATGFVLPRIVIDGVLPTLRAQLKDDPTASSFYAPFESMNSRVSADDQERLRAKAEQVIAERVMPAFARVADFLENEYDASTTLGAEQLDGGKPYYAFQIRRYTTIRDLGADEIHEIGLAEVERIKGEMLEIIDELGFEGGFEAFGEFLRTDPQFYAETAEELLKEAAYTAKRIDYKMPGFFGLLPRQSYGVIPVPEEIAPNYTTGAYYGAPLDGDVGGAYWVNTYALDQRPLYELPALTLHEAVPGHHHQNAIAAEMVGVPEFRKDLYFSAFGEGWALYTEKLGIEMDIYRTPYEHFGRLSYEMWRACRLVIDTGIHSKGWTREQAMAFLADNTSLSAGNVRAEVDRYISWPGQALAYKLGELRIWAMRRKAEETLGERFDLREFHDVLLRNGALPIAMLEAVVERYIDERLSAG